MRRGTVTDPRIDPVKRALARQFRRVPTPSEAAAWEIVRNRRLLGLKFGRQQVIDGFIVDLLCVALGVAIEIDGDVHNTPEGRAYDECRSEVITARGWHELRVSNDEVTREHLASMVSALLPLSGRPKRSAGSNGEGVGG